MDENVQAALKERDRERDIADLKEEMRELRVSVEELSTERDKALKWGIATLGGMVLSLMAWIVSVAKDHIK